MSLTVGELSGLGDMLRVGPQWAWPTHQGTPIIERGPHGARFAPIPSESPGTGVRFWRESEGDFGSQGWTPRAAVVGVMGLGDSLPELSETGRNGITKVARMLRDEVDAARAGDVRTLTSIDQRARVAHDTLGKYRPFESSWSPVIVGGWDSSQDVRSALQGVMLNARQKASGGPATDVTPRSPVVEGAKEFGVYATPSGVPGMSVGDVRDATEAGARTAKRAAKGASDAYDEAKRKLEQAARDTVDAAKPWAIGAGVVVSLVVGAYALNAVTRAKREFSGTNPRARRSVAKLPAAFRYE